MLTPNQLQPQKLQTPIVPLVCLSKSENCDNISDELNSVN